MNTNNENIQNNQNQTGRQSKAWDKADNSAPGEERKDDKSARSVDQDDGEVDADSMNAEDESETLSSGEGTDEEEERKRRSA